MAAPVGHIVCALAMLNSGVMPKVDRNEFLAGTSFPDIRYVSPISRSITHYFPEHTLQYVMAAETSFEAGRRFHVYVDRARERHMRNNDAYRFVDNSVIKTQVLKLIEDHVLFDSIKNKINASEIFAKIYQDERAYKIPLHDLEAWHRILSIYLNEDYWPYFYRYYRSIKEIRDSFEAPKKFFDGIWKSVKTAGFLVYAYFEISRLSKDEQLRAIILDFYEKKIHELIKTESQTIPDTTAQMGGGYKSRLISRMIPWSSSREVSMNPSF